VSSFYGKYRGVVADNIDPAQLGRVQVSVPAVLGEQISGWALPCLPFAGVQAGMWVVPAVGSNVWVEFEQGDPDLPIWTGGYWGSPGDMPPMALTVAPSVSHVVVQTTNQNLLSVSDAPGPAGGLLLKSATGAMIAVNETGIVISNGAGASIVLSGPTVVVNDGALEVT